MVSFADKPILPFTTPEEWDAYLRGEPDPDGVRLKLRKKAAVDPGITYAEALDIALCHGWIDGQAGAFDEQFKLQAFTPRRRASPWSKVNRDHVARLLAEGRMLPGGLAEVERARADGRWDAAYRQRDAEVSDDFQRALDADPQALAFFATVGGQKRFAFLFRLSQLKRAATRERRIAEYVALLREGRTLT
ncbi:bacteriocin-protection protein, YdeI/OmpD-associated family [Rathayibacter sp. AY1E3]|uniref:YdeI/OmpD-associated family protein n=1 Tax=unclassified Rathayibacter TaxID=2609250 RepID=UPI000CE725CB|nr:MULTISPECIES: YdeI/OmpD-associated family protein [unclassified Rathayibacter]PPH36917.1 bacteriocin-protection protein, YdeI/OmpD-associated family [Rathayibacter sp. AY1E3]PPI08877.1 bacteriocin-protection protein, YdeI/OmpD-associated family [Rathayibacter sp. AY1B8]